jgi:hypothetical protein
LARSTPTTIDHSDSDDDSKLLMKAALLIHDHITDAKALWICQGTCQGAGSYKISEPCSTLRRLLPPYQPNVHHRYVLTSVLDVKTVGVKIYDRLLHMQDGCNW